MDGHIGPDSVPQLVRFGRQRRTSEENEAEKTQSKCDNKTTLEKKTAPFLSLLLLERGPPLTSVRL